MRFTAPITTRRIIEIIEEINRTLSQRLQRKLSNSSIILEPYSSEPLVNVPDVILNKAREKIIATRQKIPEGQLETLKQFNQLIDQLTIAPSRKTPSPFAPSAAAKKRSVVSRSASTQVKPTRSNRRDSSSPCAPEPKHKSTRSRACHPQSTASPNVSASEGKQPDRSLETVRIGCTKPSVLRLNEPPFSIDRAQSTYATLTQTMKNMPTQTTEALLQAWQDQIKHWNKDFTDAPLFFGSAHGQRLLRATYHYMKQSPKTSATALIQTITAKHPDKTRWQDVANYYLKGMSSIKKAGISFEALSGWTVDRPLNKTSFWNGFAQNQLHSLPTDGNESALNKGASKSDHFTFSHLAQDITRTSYRHKPDYRGTNRSSASLQILDLLNRRACKFLLTLAAYHQRPIVYALDQLNPVVAAKGLRVEVQSKSSRKTKVPVCSSELRFLFRHADFFQSNVFFFQCLQPVMAPWFDPNAAEFWAEYALHLTRKLLSQNLIRQSQAPKIDSILSNFARQRWDKVIRLYHKLKPTSLDHPLIKTAFKKKAGRVAAILPSETQTRYARIIQSRLMEKIEASQQFIPITEAQPDNSNDIQEKSSLKAKKQSARSLLSSNSSALRSENSNMPITEEAIAVAGSQSAAPSM